MNPSSERRGPAEEASSDQMHAPVVVCTFVPARHLTCGFLLKIFDDM